MSTSDWESKSIYECNNMAFCYFQEYSEVYVTDVTANGKVCVQIHDHNWRQLQNMMQQISSGSFPKEALQASFGPLNPTPSVLYLVKSSEGEW